MTVLSPATRSGALDDGGPHPAMARHTGRSYWQALTRAALAAAVVHLAFSLVFFALHAPLLVWANLGSIAIYAWIHHLLQRRRNRRAVVLLWVEILLHALAATLVVGWDSGFHYYVLVMMPLVFVSPGRTLRIKLMLGMALAAFYIGLDAYARSHAPVTPITTGALKSRLREPHCNCMTRMLLRRHNKQPARKLAV